MNDAILRRHPLAIAIGATLWSSALLSNTAGAQDGATSARLEEVIVTGRAGAGQLNRAEASFAVSSLSADDLSKNNPLSVADVFKAVPGFWVESSGGEGSNNIRTRGIPRDGYSSISLQENGLAVQHDGGLGYLNADQSFRLDETIARVEVVRGGPSAIFASNAPGGVANFITRRSYDAPEAVLKYEAGDYSHNRIDGYYGLPVGEDMFVGMGGFYRKNDGIRDPGYTSNDGGQIRLSFGKQWDSGELFLDVKHINDKVAFLLPIPLTFDGDGGVAGVPGFDPNYGTLAGPEVEHNTYRNLGDGYDFDLADGTHTELTQFTANLDFALGSWNVHNSFRYRQSDILRNGLFPTGNIESATDRLDSYRQALAGQLPAGSDLEIRFANHPGEAFDVANNAGNGLVLNGNLLSVEVPLDEVINDFRLSRAFEFGTQTHDVSLGVYYADYDYEFVRYMATAMFEVHDQAHLLDMVAVNNGQDVLNVTEGGILRYGSLYDNVEGTGETLAFYASDEWQITDALRVDAGLRYEMIDLGGSVEGKTVVDLQQSASLADDQFITGNGVFTPIDEDYDELAWTIGVNYQFSDSFGAFARYTDSFRTPNASDYNGDPSRTDLKVEPISMAETGIKFASDQVEIYATAFYTEFDNIRFTDYVFDNTTNEYTNRTAYGDTQTVGLELETYSYFNDYVDMSLVVTWQDAEYNTFAFTELQNGEPVTVDFGGNQLIRVPELSIRAVPGVNLIQGRLRAELELEYFDDRYADVANSVVLPDYLTVGAVLRYQVTDNLSLQVNGKNLTNEIGLTEGNPRSGQFISGDAGSEFYLARPILGRSYTASIYYAF
ncbi:TonB-dependent receptor [Parahaliea mediterranea]|uniref:TonB-dependent receptor n=1 Tax=Parahaliea mediterranea TaxID=651086 RepID=UPI001472AFFA|nr:TonB-dependent receptor [Parahaliea mediterranea]